MFLAFAILWALGAALMLFARSSGSVSTGLILYACAPLFVMLGVYYFAIYFPNDKPFVNSKVFLWLPLIPPLLFTAWIVTNLDGLATYQIATTSDWSEANRITIGSNYQLYAQYFNIYFLLYTALLIKKVIFFKKDKMIKQQVLFFLVTISLTTLFAFIPNLILPTFFGNTNYIWIGPLSAALFAVLITYSILRHKLFDIRLVAARALAYLLSISVMATIYLFVVLSVGQIISIGPALNTAQRLFYVAVALIFATTLGPLKKIFDKVTNRLFYKDAYETQTVLDQVSGIIVGSVDPHKVQKGALEALTGALRPTYAAFLLGGRNGTIHKGDAAGDRWDIHDPGELQATLRRVGKKITVYDELEEGGGKLRDVLRKEDISVVAPLVTKDEIIGYLVLGAKKSGNIYNSQDVGLLNIATNELAVALQNAQRFEEIQAFNITLQEKVTEATRELKKTNKKLVALDEAKDEFISMASHQLRTPLTSIKGYLSMLIEGDLGKVTTTQEKALQDAFGSSQRMVYLIADFLNVSRIKTGKFVIDPSEVELPQIVNEEISQLREMAAAKDLKLTYEQPGIFPTVRLDENKIRQVMMNMVDNAIYYTPSGGKITIQLYVTGDDLFFKVVDTGIGVPKREQHKMFTKFFRADNAKKARPDGTGLGLFMAQKIIVEQGGAVIFESVEGKGSTFGFRFPLAKIKSS